MFRILLDSNVIARAVISPNGPAAELLALVVNSEHQLCTSDFMLAELVRVLAYPRLQKRHGLDDQAIVSFVRSIQEVSIVFDIDPQSVPKITRDINDDPVVATAVLSASQYLCSLDKDLLEPAVVRYCQSRSVVALDDVGLLNLLRG